MKSPVRTGTWIAVCDGAKALFLRNEGDHVHLNLKTEKSLNQPASPARELAADRPGRVHESTGASRSAVEETDRHEAAESEFLKSVAEEMSRIESRETGARFVLAAPPRALGMLRDMMTAPVHKAVQAEIGRDLVSMPVREIEAYLTVWFKKE